MPWNLKRYYGAGDLHFIICPRQSRGAPSFSSLPTLKRRALYLPAGDVGYLPGRPGAAVPTRAMWPSVCNYQGELLSLRHSSAAPVTVRV
jgi:hypothetical protein